MVEKFAAKYAKNGNFITKWSFERSLLLNISEKGLFKDAVRDGMSL